MQCRETDRHCADLTMNKALAKLLKDKPIAYHPVLARIAGKATGGILLGQLTYWHGVMDAKYGKTWDGWFYKSAEELEEETGLTRWELETARKRLVQLGLIEFKNAGRPRKSYYKVSLDAIEQALSTDERPISESRRKTNANLKRRTLETNPHPSALETNEQPVGNEQTISVGNQRAVQENTTESTQESTRATEEKSEKPPDATPAPVTLVLAEEEPIEDVEFEEEPILVKESPAVSPAAAYRRRVQEALAVGKGSGDDGTRKGRSQFSQQDWNLALEIARVLDPYYANLDVEQFRGIGRTFTDDYAYIAMRINKDISDGVMTREWVLDQFKKLRGTGLNSPRAVASALGKRIADRSKPKKSLMEILAPYMRD